MCAILSGHGGGVLLRDRDDAFHREADLTRIVAHFVMLAAE